jgi:hypothetical protein
LDRYPLLRPVAVGPVPAEDFVEAKVKVEAKVEARVKVEAKVKVEGLAA